MKISRIGTRTALLLLAAVGSRAQTLSTKQAEAKVRAIVQRMTLPEKISQLHGVRDEHHYRFVPGVSRLGIPSLTMTNGPAGAGPGGSSPQLRATALPAPIALAASWDTNAARKYGEVAGSEASDLGSDLLEAPDVNIARVPQSGRVFEAYGEDPFLASRLAVANIIGIQSSGVMANVKHYVANNQETDRGSINEIVGARALREIYMPAFRAAVKDGHVASVMCAYPRVNGEFNCANKFLLTDVLKDDWHFEGFVISDFGAVHSTIPSALAGLDLEMPTGKYFSAQLQQAVQSGTVPSSLIDDKLIRRYATMMQFGMFGKRRSMQAIPVLADGAVARSIAEEGAVLLRNQNHLLPLDYRSLHSVALIGPYAVRTLTGGGGSSLVIPFYSIQPEDGIRAHLPDQAKLTVLDGSDIPAAADAAAKAAVAIVVVGDQDTEGQDQSLTLPGHQDDLITAIAHANPRTVVVLQTGSAVLMPWLQNVPAVLETWYPGEEDGNVLADILFGTVDPSGKLPVTFPRRVQDTLANNSMQYPGDGTTVHYTEGIQVGYRWYQTHNVRPLFPFGFGLSYTTFAYSDFSVAHVDSSTHAVTLRFRVKNVGTYPGAEVAQLYVDFPPIDEGNEPPEQLKGFRRVTLQPGQSEAVAMTLNARAFSYWSEMDHAWRIQPGIYSLMAGSSSANILLHGSVEFH